MPLSLWVNDTHAAVCEPQSSFLIVGYQNPFAGGMWFWERGRGRGGVMMTVKMEMGVLHSVWALQLKRYVHEGRCCCCPTHHITCNWGTSVSLVATEACLYLQLQLRHVCIFSCNWGTSVSLVATEARLYLQLQLRHVCIFSCNWGTSVSIVATEARLYL
jgi:hypothetical protein